jgi:hypothetical protein
MIIFIPVLLIIIIFLFPKKKKRFFKSQKVNKILNESSRHWFLAVAIYIFLSNWNDPSTDTPSELSYILKDNNSLLACLPVAFYTILIIKLIEFYLVFIRSGRVIPKDKSLLFWLVKRFHISYTPEQVILKDETILLGFQFFFCTFGFFYELKWYLLGAVSLIIYFILYILMSFNDIKKIFTSVKIHK